MALNVGQALVFIKVAGTILKLPLVQFGVEAKKDLENQMDEYGELMKRGEVEKAKQVRSKMQPNINMTVWQDVKWSVRGLWQNMFNFRLRKILYGIVCWPILGAAIYYSTLWALDNKLKFVIYTVILTAITLLYFKWNHPRVQVVKDRLKPEIMPAWSWFEGLVFSLRNQGRELDRSGIDGPLIIFYKKMKEIYERVMGKKSADVSDVET